MFINQSNLIGVPRILFFRFDAKSLTWNLPKPCPAKNRFDCTCSNVATVTTGNWIIQKIKTLVDWVTE